MVKKLLATRDSKGNSLNDAELTESDLRDQGNLRALLRVQRRMP